MTLQLDPLVPRSIDLPTTVPLEPDADLGALDRAKILAPPDDPAERQAWRQALARWHAEARQRTAYSGDLYDEPALQWTQTCFCVCLTWLWDETLYDFATGSFTPEAFIEAARRDFGGVDGIVLWQAYPVIGLDPRNQFDFYRDVPGIGQLVRDLQRGGLRVFLSYNPWDVGTRREETGDIAALTGLVADLEVDGIFLDTLREGDPGLVNALAGSSRPLALEGESSIPLARISDHTLSWAQWCADSPTPGVLRAHWFERRHQMHQTRRWNRDHTEELQTAWLNGCGMLVWENVFGSWVGWNKRDRSLLRRMLPVQRRFSRLLIEGAWTPLAGGSPGPLFASRFDLGAQSLWLIANRSSEAFQWELEPEAQGRLCFELTRGLELETGTGISVPGRGVAAVLAAPKAMFDADLTGFLADQAVLEDDSDCSFPARTPIRVPVRSAPVAPVPEGMRIVDGGERELIVSYQVRETGLYSEAPFVEEWKPLPPRLHAITHQSHEIHLSAFAIATKEVSNDEFAAFLRATSYQPEQPSRFLKHWIDGRPPPGRGSEPVTYIDLWDARVYSTWKGTRLPTEHEWQVAAESGLLRRRRPLVWNWTESEHSDGRTRWSILKGAAFSAQGSQWYLPGGPRDASFSVKLLLCGGGLARSSQIGFRCAADVQAQA